MLAVYDYVLTDDTGAMKGKRPRSSRDNPTTGRYQLHPTPIILRVRVMDTVKGRLVMPRVTMLLTMGNMSRKCPSKELKQHKPRNNGNQPTRR